MTTSAKVVQCSSCHRVCCEEDFGEDQNGSAFCEQCGADSYYCINSTGKRCSLSEHDEALWPPQSPWQVREFPSLKAYQEYLACPEYKGVGIVPKDFQQEFQQEFLQESAMERAERVYREGPRLHYMSVPVDETWSKEALIGLVMESQQREEEQRKRHRADIR